MKNKPERVENFKRTNLSLSEVARQKAQACADELFGGNISAFITHLILNADKERCDTPKSTSIGDGNNFNGAIIASGERSKIKSKSKK